MENNSYNSCIIGNEKYFVGQIDILPIECIDRPDYTLSKLMCAIFICVHGLVPKQFGLWQYDSLAFEHPVHEIY